jgi:hypothetical protein
MASKLYELDEPPLNEPEGIHPAHNSVFCLTQVSLRPSGCLSTTSTWCREIRTSYKLRHAPNMDQAKSLPTHLSYYTKTRSHLP